MSRGRNIWMCVTAVAVCAASLTPSTALAGGDLDPSLIGVHPRLLYSSDEMAAWRQAGPEAQRFIWDAGKDYFEACAGRAAAGEPWNVGDGWQRWGWWWGTTAAFLYAKSGDERYADSAVDLMMRMCASEHWELGGERDYGMGAANIMATVAIIYDTCYDTLSDEQRDLVRKRLLLAAERMHDYGFYQIRQLDKPAARYWQNDPQNNHRWHRVCGYLLATLAVSGEIEGIEPYLADAIDQLEFILAWLPQDGSCHESVGYQAFGTQFLVPATVALDRNTGTKHLTSNRGFREFPHFRAHMVTPDRRHVWSFGDGGESPYYFSHYNFKLASAWSDRYMQAAHLANFAAAPGSYGYHGFTLIWHDPTLAPADLGDYPRWRYFPDMGIATFRADWNDPSALACFFKCGPYGGHRLNEFRDRRTPPFYVNVAHDHPDANSFLVSFDGQLMAQDYGTHARVSSEHNTITVNGKSQAGSGDSWTQPIEAMGRRARVEQYFGAPGFGMIRGEAGGFYEDLSRYARTLVYMDDAYLLVADDIRAPEPVSLEWYYNTTADITPVDEPAADGVARWLISREDSVIELTMAGPATLRTKINEPAEARSGRRPTRRGIQATAADQRRGDMLMLIAPRSYGDVSRKVVPARLVDVSLDGLDVKAEVARGELTDLVVVSADMAATEWKGLRSDAQCAAVTLAAGKPVKVMLSGGRSLSYGDFAISFSRPVCALFDPAAAELTVNAPLEEPAFSATVALRGGSLIRVNGRLVGPGGEGVYAIDVPTWQQRQDDEDGFTKLEAAMAK